MRYYCPTVLIVGREKPVFEGLKFFNVANLKIEGSQKQVEGAQRLEQRAVSPITEHGAHKTGTQVIFQPVVTFENVSNNQFHSLLLLDNGH